MAFNQRLFSVKLSNSFQSFKHWKELRRITAQKKEKFCSFRFQILHISFLRLYNYGQNSNNIFN